MSSISERNPFVGPRPIRQGEALYGRDVEVRELYHRLQARRIVVLHSPSGAGKSSLVQAGLIPRLVEEGYDVWKPIRVNLDASGLEGVPADANRYLLSAMINLEDELPDGRRRGPAALAGLDFRAYLDQRPRRRGRSNQPVVLIFDQFEEVLTVAPLAVEARRAFFTAVGQALESKHYWALFLIREDHLGALAPYRGRIPTQMSNTFRLDLLGLAGAREAAKNLAEQGGRTFPAVDQLIRDLSRVQAQQADGSFVAEQGLYVEPVQLQVVCRRLWDAMPADDLSIDPEDIEAYASVSSALGSYYADAVRAIADGDVAAERALRDWVGKKLIVGGIRSQVRQEAGKSAGLENQRILRLLDSFLVRVEQRAGVHWFELSHDRLVEPVLLDNQQWEQANLHPLQVQAKLWEDSRRPGALLLGAEALLDADAWATDHPALLTEGEREFLALSRDLQAREQAARRRLVALAAAAAAVAVVVGVLGVVAWVAWQAARASEASALTATEEAVKERDAARVAREGADVARSLAEGAEKKAEDARRGAVASEQEAVAAEKVAVTARRENEKLLQNVFRAALRSLIVDLAREGSLSGEVEVDERWSSLLDPHFAAFTVIDNGGRIIVAGHDAVLSSADRRGYSVFLEMTSKWLIGNQQQDHIVILSDPGGPALRTVKKLEQNLATLKYNYQTNPSLDALAHAGMLIVANRHVDFTDEELKAIQGFLARGGGVLAVGVGYAWIAHKPAKGQEPPTIANYPMNRLLDGYGARWNDKKIEGLEKPPEPKVTLYEDDNFRGRSQSFGVGEYDAHTFRRIGNNTASSVKVDPALQVTLYEDKGFMGGQQVLTGDAFDLDYFDDLCSGLIVAPRRPDDAPKVTSTQPQQAPPEQVEVFENVNFTGAVQRFGIGKYTDLGFVDDRISSIRVPEGLYVTLYDRSDLGGDSKVLTRDARSLHGFNDRCSGIEVKKLEPGDLSSLRFTGTIKGIYFDRDKDTIKPKSRPVLDRTVSVLQEFLSLRLTIACHTDNEGSPDFLKDLTLRRAMSVKRYLVEHGVESGRLETRGAGADEPVETNKTAAGRAMNRRCEFNMILK